MTIFSYSLRYGNCLRGITIASFVSSKREIGSGAFLISKTDLSSPLIMRLFDAEQCHNPLYDRFAGLLDG